MREKVIESYLRDQVKKIGGKAFKFESPGNAGVPDRIVILPGGRIHFIELKAPGRTTSKIQDKQISDLKNLGCDARVIDSKEKVDSFIFEVTWRANI